MSGYFVEICCGSADDVIEAAKGGAKRVELNSNLFLGGLTPTVGTLRIAKRHADASVMCMVRPREGGFCYTGKEYETALEDAAALLENGADGLVFGFLDADGRVDRARCAELVRLAGDKDTVFHRAIDVAPDWRAVLDVLMDLGVTRVLTSGQSPSVLSGAEVIRQMVEYAAGRIEILPGGDITPGNLRAVIQATGLRECHLGLTKPCFDHSVQHNPAIHYGGALYPPENVFQMTDAQAVARLCAALD